VFVGVLPKIVCALPGDLFLADVSPSIAVLTCLVLSLAIAFNESSSASLALSFCSFLNLSALVSPVTLCVSSGFNG